MADANASMRLLTHPKVKAISFVGSTPIAKYIFEIGTKHGKRVQSNGGAKNFVFLMPDADVENSVRGVIEAAFGCAGERCMAGSTAVVIGDAAKTVLPALVEAARAIKVGPTDRRSAAEHGPGDHAATSRPRAAIDRSRRERRRENPRRWPGVKVDGAPNGFFVGATILDEVQTGMTVAKEEIFGPVLNVMRIGRSGCRHRTGQPFALRQWRLHFHPLRQSGARIQASHQCGMVGINIGVPASMAWFPFNGWNDSFFGDLHMQGKEGVQFFTQQKVTTTRWFSFGEGDIWHREENEVIMALSDQERRNRHRQRALHRRHLLRERNHHAHRAQYHAAAGAEVIDANGKFVFPGFIDPHVHIYLPFMGTFAKDTHETASKAALIGGTTTFIEMICPARSDEPMEASSCGCGKAEGKSACDFTFHMGVTRYRRRGRKATSAKSSSAA